MRHFVLVLAGCALLVPLLQRPSSERLFRQGSLVQTCNPYDLAIKGAGFFPVTLPDGRRGYTRDGAFRLDAKSEELVTHSDCRVGLALPREYVCVQVTPEGEVRGVDLMGEGQVEVIGQLKLVRFPDSRGLKPVTPNTFVATPECGILVEDRPGQNGLGVLAQGYLEDWLHERPQQIFPGSFSILP